MSDMATTGPKRTSDQRLADEAMVAMLHLQNLSQEAIAARLNARSGIPYQITQRTISRDIRRIQERWRDTYPEDYAQAIRTELNRLEIMEAEAFEAWQRSKETKETSLANQINTGKFRIIKDKDGKEIRREEIIKTSVRSVRQEQDPNPRYLEVMLQCQARRAKLLGIDAPDKTILVSESGELSLDNLMDKSVQAAEERLIALGIIPEDGEPLAVDPAALN